ncbi:VapC toxin family PIN domain ribonuclease, partial [Mycobacterium tuberculosis]
MFLLAAPVLLAAPRGAPPPPRPVRPWFARLLAAAAPFPVPPLVWASFLRLAP